MPQSQFVIDDVLTLGAAVRSIVNLNGREEGTYLLLSRSVMAGCCDFVKDPELYSDNVKRLRHEAIRVEQRLRCAASRLCYESAERMTQEILPSGWWQEYIENPSLSRSSLLNIVVPGLLSMKSDYRRDRMVSFGQSLDNRLMAPGRYVTPVRVDLEDLDRKKLSLPIKILYRELQVVRDCALTNFRDTN